MKFIKKIIILFSAIILTGLMFSMESNAANPRVDLGKNASMDPFYNLTTGKRELFCAQKGGSVKGEMGTITYKAYGNEKAMDELLACWLRRLNGDLYSQQIVIWNQDGNSKYSLADISDNTSTPPLTVNAKNEYEKAKEELKGRSDSTDVANHRKFELNNSIVNRNDVIKYTEGDTNSANDDSKLQLQKSEKTTTKDGITYGYYELKHVKLDWLYDEKGDGTYSYISHIDLVDPKTGDTVFANLGFRYNNTDHISGDGDVDNKENYQKIDGTGNIRIYIRSDKVEADKTYRIKIYHEWKVGSSATGKGYSGTYQRWTKDDFTGNWSDATKTIQRMVTFNTSEADKPGKNGSNSTYLRIRIKSDGSKGELTYAKYLYGVYAKDDCNSIAKADSSEAVMGGYKLVGHCLEPEFDDDGTCTNADDLAKPYYTDGPYIGQKVSFNISEIQNNDVILVYKLRWYNYSDIATALYQKGINEKYKEVKDSFGGALNLAYIDRDGSVDLTETGDLIVPDFDQTITVTPTTTIWRDVDFADGKYKSGTVTYDKTDWPVYYREYDKEITIKTYRTCNPTLQPGEIQDVFSFIFYYAPINAANTSAANTSNNSIYVPPTMNISGQIFLDEYDTDGNKTTGNVDGIKNNGEQLLNEPVKVELYQYSYTEEQQKALLNEKMVNQLTGISSENDFAKDMLEHEIYDKIAKEYEKEIRDEKTGKKHYEYDKGYTKYDRQLVAMNKYKNNTITSTELNKLLVEIRSDLKKETDYVIPEDDEKYKYEKTYLYKGQMIDFSIGDFKTGMEQLKYRVDNHNYNFSELLDMINELMEIIEKQENFDSDSDERVNYDKYPNNDFGRLSSEKQLYLILKETKSYIKEPNNNSSYWKKYAYTGEIDKINDIAFKALEQICTTTKYKYENINKFNGEAIVNDNNNINFDYTIYENEKDYEKKKEYLKILDNLLIKNSYNSGVIKLRDEISNAIKYIDGDIKIYDYQTEKDRASTGDDYKHWDDLNKEIKSRFSVERVYEKQDVVKYLDVTLGANFDKEGFEDRCQKLKNNNITNEELKKFNEEFNLIYNIQKSKVEATHKNVQEELTINEELRLIELIEQYFNANKVIAPVKNYKNQDIKFTEANTNELIKILQKFLKIGLTDEERNSIFNKDNFIDYQIVTNGQYEFKNYPVYSCEAFGDTPLYYLVNGQKMYYAVKFIYNGEKYESTLYMQQGGINSRATEDLYINKGRSMFNENLENSNYKFNYNSVTANEVAKNRLNQESTINSSNADLLSHELLIDASTDPWEEPISAGNNTNVNLGLIRRNFDLRLETSLESMDVSINGVSQSLKGYGSPTISANISSSDLVDDKLNQKLAIQESDYKADDIEKPLEVWVNYKVKVSNESVAYYGNSKVEVYCDNRFTAFKIGNSSETQLNNNNGKNEPIVVDLSSVALNNVESSKEINISMKLDRQTIKDIMEKNSSSFVRTLEFIAQINNHTSYYNDNAYGKGYAKGTIAGKLDEDSIPGNLDINEYNKLTTSKDRTDYINKEDDADRALGVQLIKQEESRKITGIVFEDATSQHGEDLRGTRAQNNAKLRYGNGKYREGETDQKDKPIEGVKVRLIDGTSGKTYEKTSGTDGTYTIENIIPSANYTIEFTYGDGETKQYNYQDYKSTIDTSNIDYGIKTNGTDSKENVIVANGKENYWYSNAANNSVAKDKEKKYNWEQSMTYTKAVELENYKDSESNDLSNTAATAKFVVPITEYGKDSSGNAAFTINNMNFGLAEKPRSELTINKVVDHITITTSDGRTLIDGTPNGINSTSWTDRYVQAIVDENLIYGSTLKITYKYYVTNTGEIDFAYVGVNNFYDYGKIGQEGGMVIKTRADKIIDYVDNNLMYDEKMQANPEDTKLNENYWKIAEDEDLNLLGEKANKSAKNINTKLVTTELSEYLEPGESTEPIYLTLSKVLSSSEDKNKNALTYNNYAEVIKSTNQLGRRSYHTTTTPNKGENDNYTTKAKKDRNEITGFEITNNGNNENILLSDVVKRGAPVTEEERMNQTGKQLVLSIPGDLDMSKVSNGTSTLYWEPDSDIDLAGGSVQIVPPFGSQKVIWTIIAIVSTTILAVGIILIKKKVLK